MSTKTYVEKDEKEHKNRRSRGGGHRLSSMDILRLDKTDVRFKKERRKFIYVSHFFTPSLTNSELYSGTTYGGKSRMGDRNRVQRD